MQPLTRSHASREGTGAQRRSVRLQTLFCATLLVLVTAALAPSNRAYAQGFGVYEQGTCTMSRGGAAVANPCEDGSAVFFNPAGLTGETGFTVSAGATLIQAQGNFTDDLTGTTTELDNPPIPVPHAYLRYGATDRLAAGLGVYVPYGLGTEWPTDFEGRFLGYDNNLQSIYVQPTLAYRLTDRIAVGGGLTVVIGSVELNQRLDLSQQTVPTTFGVPEGTTFGGLGIPFHTDFADASLEATGATGFGGNIGIQVQATDRIQLGARFMTPVQLDYSGTAEFSQVNTDLVLYGLIDANGDGIPDPVPVDNLLAPLFQQGPLVEQDIETSITMPAQLVAGVSVQATDRLALLADYQWTGWSSFDELELDFEQDALDQTLEENYNDTHALRLGAEYAATEAWQLRAGFLTHGAAAPDETVTPLLPEAYRNEFTAGFGWRPSDLVEVNVAYQYIQQNDRRGRVRDVLPGEEDPSTEDLNSGLYGFNAHLIGTTLTLHF